jgi:dissimilatory sulfite reductase (desulfoviridin) alpha/beta subunit
MSKQTKYVDILVDGRGYVGLIEEQKAIGYIIAPCISIIKYMSEDAIIKWIEQACEMVKETSEGKDASVNRKIGSIITHLKEREYTLEELQQIAVNIHLNCSDLGLLPGFKYGKVDAKGRIVSKRDINPEYLSTYKLENK